MPALIEIKDPAPAPWMGKVVLTHGSGEGDGHEIATHQMVAQRVASLLDIPYAGAHRAMQPTGASYCVPRASLTGRRIAASLGIRSENDLLGGWVLRKWMVTKAIVHPVASPKAVVPSGWSHRLAKEAIPLTLRGFTAFSRPDALAAGNMLVERGPVRLKPVSEDGGRGQIVARNRAELDRAIASLCMGGKLTDAVTLEENLDEVVTYSVGQVRLPNRTVSYCGTQTLTRNNEGASAYGGSVLFVVRGGFDDLLAHPLPLEIGEAINQAAAFDALADRHLPGLIASRRNYDVASGMAADGARRMGVLEQSWRIGGATGAEIAALEVFAREPHVTAVHARTVEIYGSAPSLPEGAALYYQGNDPVLGPLTKYACVEKKIEG